jgi:hypothetical protein
MAAQKKKSKRVIKVPREKGLNALVWTAGCYDIGPTYSFKRFEDKIAFLVPLFSQKGDVQGFPLSSSIFAFVNGCSSLSQAHFFLDRFLG